MAAAKRARGTGAYFASFWERLTEPAAMVTNQEERRRLRLLLSILFVVAFLVVLTFAATPLRLLAPLTAHQRYTATLILPTILAVFTPLLLSCILLAKRGHYKTAARILVAYGSAASFYYVWTAGDASSLSMPVLAVVLCSLLLTPLDTLGIFLITVAEYILLNTFVPGLTSWDVFGTLIIVTAVGALSTMEVIVRGQDLRHIERQAEELKKNHDQLVDARKMEAVARLSAGVAHEFNNILTAIMGFADVIDLRPAERGQEYTSKIRTAGVRAIQMTEGLLSFSQQQLMDPQAANVDDLLKNHEQSLKAELRRGTHLILNLSAETKIVEVDVELFRRALLTFVKAAERNLSGEGTISIESRGTKFSEDNPMLLPEGDYCSIEIHDNGVPKDSEFLSRIFDPFFTRGEFGTGNLDLAAAYGIVRQTGGQIETRSEAGRGNTIRMVLPQR